MASVWWPIINPTSSFDGALYVSDTTNSTLPGNGSIQTDGGLGVIQDTNMGGSLRVQSTLDVNGIISANNTANSEDENTGGVVVTGGVGIAKDVNIGGDLFVDGVKIDPGSLPSFGGPTAPDIPTFGKDLIISRDVYAGENLRLVDTVITLGPELLATIAGSIPTGWNTLITTPSGTHGITVDGSAVTMLSGDGYGETNLYTDPITSLVGESVYQVVFNLVETASQYRRQFGIGSGLTIPIGNYYFFNIFDSFADDYEIDGSGNVSFQFTLPTGIDPIFNFSSSDPTSGLTYILDNISMTLYTVTTDENIALRAPAGLPASYTMTYPPNDGEADGLLQTDGSGVTNWVNTMDSENFYIGDGTDLTKRMRIDTSAITTGTDRVITMPDADVNLGSLGASELNDLTDANTSSSSIAVGGTNVAGSSTTSVGINALLNNTGNYNTAEGSSSLRNNTSGINNTAAGFVSLYSNLVGSDSSAFGYYSLYYSLLFTKQ